MKRHRQVLLKRKGKITSPTRKSCSTITKTQNFINMFDKKIQSGKVNYHNIVVFDETINGDSVTVPVVIGQRRNSGGNNNNVVHTRQARLGCYIPFSMPDGTTPFRVFIFNDKDLDDSGSTFRVLTPKKEKGYRGDPVRLYLSSGCSIQYKQKQLHSGKYILIFVPASHSLPVQRGCVCGS